MIRGWVRKSGVLKVEGAAFREAEVRFGGCVRKSGVPKVEGAAFREAELIDLGEI